jgi:hypothetical protein
MSWVYGHQWVDAARAQRAELERGLAYNDQLLSQHTQRRAEVARQANLALEELTATLLPSLDRAALERAAALTGYTPLVQHDLRAMVEAERAELGDKIARIEAQPRFVHREHLRDPRGGKLVLELAELLEAQRSVRAVITQCEHPRLSHLVEVGYGTPSYAVPFWRLSYYADWEAGDAILERFPGKSFSEVRDELLRAEDAHRNLEARIQELKTQIADIDALVRAHAEAVEARRTVDLRHLQRARSHLARHVADSGPAAVGPRLAAAPDVEVIAKRVFGLAAKLAYLDRLGEAQLGRARAEMLEGIRRADAEILKMSRPKKLQAVLPLDKFQRRFRPRNERYLKGWQRYQRAADTIYVFDRYDRGSWVADFLWWDLMTDGRIDGDFIPEVAWHHQRYPDAYHERDDDGALAAAAAVGAHDELDDPPGLLDPS